MQNRQAGTRGLSAADWTRLTKLSKPIENFTDDQGSSIIRSPASNWTDVMAKRRADYVTQQQIGTGRPVLMLHGVCLCSTTVLSTKVTYCSRCRPIADTTS